MMPFHLAPDLAYFGHFLIRECDFGDVVCNAGALQGSLFPCDRYARRVTSRRCRRGAAGASLPL